MKKSLKTLLPCLLALISLNSNADALGAVQSIDNAIRATSLVDIISKAKGVGLDEAQVSTIPQIEIIADCGDCKITNATKFLLLSSYAETARANQISIGVDKVKFKITKYITRNSFARGVLGVLSGADYVSGHFENDTKSISTFSISHEMGIHEITQKLGEDLVKYQVKSNIQNLNVQ